MDPMGAPRPFKPLSEPQRPVFEPESRFWSLRVGGMRRPPLNCSNARVPIPTHYHSYLLLGVLHVVAAAPRTGMSSSSHIALQARSGALLWERLDFRM